jgi:hypothetical protein
METIQDEVDQATNNQNVEYLVAYAKIVEDDDGIILQGVYFGGIGTTYEAAEGIARDCVNQVRGGTVLPKVVKLTRPCQVIDALFDAADNFEAITAQMIEADATIRKTHSKRK